MGCEKVDNYDYNKNLYLLPLKVNTSKSKIAWTYIGGIFLFVTMTFSLLSAFAIETCINEGCSLFFVSFAIGTAFIGLSSLITILPRRLIIDDEKVQLKCLAYKKEIYWADLSSLSVNVSDVAFSSRPVWEKDKNLVMHKANQTMPGYRVGIKNVELLFRKKNGKMGTFKFFIPTDSYINFEVLTKTICHTYKQAKLSSD
jgi:hypothetical protein